MNSSFSQITPSLQLAWDSTSLDAFKQCPRKYQLSILLGFASTQQNIHLEFGILYHEGLEYFQRLLSEGLTHEQAQIKMLRRSLERTWVPPGKPWFTGDAYKNRFTLLRSLIWHTEQYKDDSLSTIIIADKPAVELSFQYSTDAKSKDGESFLLCGHLDRLVSASGLTFGLDYKTTKYDVRGGDYFQFYSPDNQMSMYTLAGKIILKADIQGIIIDAAQVQVNATRFGRAPITRSPTQVEEWFKELTQYWLPLAESCSRQDSWPMNDTACGRYGGCQFRGVCGKSPEVREQWLKASFSKRVWDPLRVRGDI